MTAAAKSKSPQAVRKSARRKPNPKRFNQPDHGPEERWQHGKMELVLPPETSGAGVKVARDQWSRQIDRLNERGQINDRQWRAAENLYYEWLCSGLSRPLAGGYEGGGSGSNRRKHGRRPSEPYELNSMYNSYMEAINKLPYNVACIVRGVVVYDGAPTEVARLSNIPYRALPLLQEGLDILVGHYKVPENPNQ